MSRERVCFEGDAQVGVVQDKDGGIISIFTFRAAEYVDIANRVKSVGLEFTRDWMQGMSRVKAEDLHIVPEVVGVVRPAAVQLDGGFATAEGWYSTDEFLMEEDD